MSHFNESVGERIRILREEAGMNQSELAKRLTNNGFPIKQVQLSRVETGERALRLEEAWTVAQALGQPFAKIIEGHRLAQDEAESQMQEALRELDQRRARLAEIDQQRADLKREIVYYTKVVQACSQRLADLQDQIDDDVDDAEIGYEEI